MRKTIEQGQYGYLTGTGFHQFSLEELKKFAVQVVALFKLDESQQNFESQSLPIPVIQNDITASSTNYAYQQQQELPNEAASNFTASANQNNMFSAATSTAR